MANIADIPLSPAARLKAWREQAGLNQSQAATKLGIHQSLLSEYESAKRKPGVSNAVRIETVAGIEVRAWADLGDEPPAA